MQTQKSRPILKASEIAQFSYCSVAWYLQKKGYKPESPLLDRGLQKHIYLGDQIDSVAEARRTSKWFFWAACCVLLFAAVVFLWWLMSKAFIFFLIAGLTLLIVGTVLTSESRQRYKRAKNIRRAYGIPDGTITYSDLNRPAQPLFSKELGLTGKPDYIVLHKGQYIPVEVKTGTTVKPYWNHVMQLAAYCLLLEEQYNAAVPFGVLTYGDRRQFKIPFGSELKKKIEVTMAEMRAQLWGNQAERNHNIATKCQSCSLGRYCTQKIV